MENINNSTNNQNSEDDLNLQFFLRTLKREKIFLFTFIFISILISTIFSLVAKPIWQGSFNIVVKDKKENNNTLTATGISFLDDLTKDQNETQKLILKSPSVLLPVYEFVQKYNIENGNKKNNTTFKGWLEKYLIIDFEDNSQVLNVIYKNSDKDLIIKSLNLISEKYKNYSTKEKEKDLNRTISYLNSQTKLMKQRSLESQKRFNKFSIENGLGNIDGFIGLGKEPNNLSSIKDPNLSKLLTNNKFSNLKYNKSSMQTFDNGDSSAGQRFNNQFIKLEKYEAEYTDLSAKLKPNSKLLNDLKIRIENLRESLKRPNEILLEYKSLKASAMRDESILNNLEDNLELVKLEKIVTPDAWEMISVPTIQNSPIFPNKKLLLLGSIIISFILGSLIALGKEKISGFIYEFDNLYKKIPYKFLGNLLTKNPKLNSILIENLIKNNSKNDNFGVVMISNNFFLNKEYKMEYFAEKSIKAQNIYSNNFEDIEKCDSLILFTSSGSITYENLEIFINYFSVHKEKIIGWFFINNDLSPKI